MKNFKRIAAIVGVILLLAAFCLPMIFAMGSGENSQAMFRGALGVAFFVPVFVYIVWMVYRMVGPKKIKETREIENIIFDVGQVLVKFDWETYLRSYHFSEEIYEKIADATFRSQTWNDRDSGLLTEEEYVQKMAETLPEYDAEVRKVMAGTPSCISLMPYAKTWTQYLKSQGYHLYILSNYGTYMLGKNRPMMTFLEEMDGEVFSCDAGLIKPDPAIYQYLLKRFGLKAEKCVFLDDKKENCEAAEKQGIHAIQFQDLKQAAKELEKLGIK